MQKSPEKHYQKNKWKTTTMNNDHILNAYDSTSWYFSFLLTYWNKKHSIDE